MGLIKAISGAVGGVFADQWKEYFYCDAIPAEVLAIKGEKRTSGRSSNTKGEDNIISNGSVIAVADGQCMCIVEQGKVVDICAEPGEYTYDTSTEPSIFAGKLGTSIIDSFKTIGKRFTFGGDTAKDQRVYYFNTKELVGNKYGTPSPVPFRVVDERAGIDIDINIRCFGEYSYKLADPILFYTNVCGNVAYKYTRDELDSQLKSELLTALQPAFAKISAMGIRYSALPGCTTEMADALNEVLSGKWRGLRGIEIVSFGVSSVKADEEDEKMIKEMQRNAAFMDPTRAAAHLVGAQAAAMQAAASNEGAGSAMAFMGMNMAQGAGGFNTQNLYAMGQQQAAAAPAPAPAPAAPAADSWTCACGAANTGKFCTSCGAAKPADGWTCSCGQVNKGKFCAECGAKKPAGVPQYKCDKCGWEPEDPKNPPKFCPECGDPFG
ncbi:MAG: SPFH domain-containing protein, partial [Oscillospiraceae bacterium]|nr:SPFH domain-containing protein [Oscillospiraceae bacterium]